MSNYTLFTPGPVDVPDEILQETSRPLLYHREEKFSALAEQTCKNLKKLLATTGRVFFFASSGTGAMEAACCNILSSGDKPVVAICGKFGQRWLELCEAYDIEPVVIKEDYGRSIHPEHIEKILQKKKQAVLFTTLAETSTGALNDIKSFGEISKKYGAYLVVDGVAGIGADYCLQDVWNIDILVGASQKALMSPPGVSFISVNERAMKKIENSDLPKYYFSLAIYEKFRKKHQTPWTPAITILYGLKKGTDMILTRGMEKNFEHHRKIAYYAREEVKKMGLEILAEYPSNALTVVKMPTHVSSTELIQEIKTKHGILFADGQAELKGKVIRIGHMGNYTIDKLGGALDALKDVFNQRRV